MSQETDDELRARIVYVAGDNQETRYATGIKLDDIAWRYGLRRRYGKQLEFGWI